jgi:hypothetical protein
MCGIEHARAYMVQQLQLVGAYENLLTSFDFYLHSNIDTRNLLSNQTRAPLQPSNTSLLYKN